MRAFVVPFYIRTSAGTIASSNCQNQIEVVFSSAHHQIYWVRCGRSTCGKSMNVSEAAIYYNLLHRSDLAHITSRTPIPEVTI